MTPMTRRQFLEASAASLILASAGEAAGSALDAGKPWYATMRRCGQINFNETDPLTLDANAWMDYFASLKVDGVMLNGGGIVAFYPTQVPYQHRSEFLGTRDLFGDVVAAARKRKLRVVARMDCNYAYTEAFSAHPEWFQANRDGSPRTEPECPWLYRTCMFSTYFTEQMPAIYRELNKRYAPDSFYTNGWPSLGALEVCYCANCQKIYKEQTGGIPPETTDVRSAVYRRYYEVSMDRIAEIWKLWNGVAKEANPESVYVGNLGGGLDTVKDAKRLSEVAAWFNADHQGRSGNTPLWACAAQGRVAQSVMNGRTITNVVGAYSTGSPLWRHTSKPAPETELWIAQAAASGMVPWFHWLGGSPQDTRWRETGRASFDWLAKNEQHFRNRRSLANIAVLYPQSTIAFYQSNGTRERTLNRARIDQVDYIQGLYYALLKGRFLFDFVHQENLTPETLKPYRALLIPNAAYLRDKECEAIQQYAASGGSVLATFETSRYNEWGEPRGDFGLRELFGVSVAGEVLGPHGNSYMHIDKPHSILEGFAGTDLLPGPEYRVPVSHLEAESLYLSVVPAYPAFPPEMVYPRVKKTNEPAVILRQNGASRVAYFPGDIGRTAWLSGNPDISRLICNSVKWLLAERDLPATVEGKGMLELFAWETEPGYALHILNYTNPNMTRPFVTELYPVGPLKASFVVPEGKTLTSVRALKADRRLGFKQEGRSVRFEVPSVEDYEVVSLT
ncbi:MAG TPA: alpha-amylase family protein [Acidobacteriaceae bacterium]|nr:alpha-amylase family protein [Acidobacteriaceae bacterium]